jgi:hypothetical protein
MPRDGRTVKLRKIEQLENAPFHLSRGIAYPLKLIGELRRSQPNSRDARAVRLVTARAALGASHRSATARPSNS